MVNKSIHVYHLEDAQSIVDHIEWWSSEYTLKQRYMKKVWKSLAFFMSRMMTNCKAFSKEWYSQWQNSLPRKEYCGIKFKYKVVNLAWILNCTELKKGTDLNLICIEKISKLIESAELSMCVIRSFYIILLPHPFPLLYEGSMFLTRRLHWTRSWASSLDNSLSDKSFLMLSNHLRFGLSLLLFPSTSIPITLLPTYSSSLLNTCPNHFNLLSCTFFFIFLPPSVSLKLFHS